MNQFMEMAIAEARRGIEHEQGGPFGAVIVKGGEVVAKGHNLVLSSHDPTSHGEISAIRKACKALDTYDLSGCEIYTTGEPCNMCLCACLWANIEKIYYGCSIKDNGKIGFRDSKFDKIFGGREKLGDYLECIDRDECLKLFDDYKKMKHETY